MPSVALLAGTSDTWFVPKQKGKNIRAIITPLWNDNGVLVNFDNIRVFASQAYNSAWVQFPSEMQAQAVIVVVVVAHIGEHKQCGRKRPLGMMMAVMMIMKGTFQSNGI